MPYRRLPNIDAARIQALTNAINKSMSLHSNDFAFPYKILQKAKFFYLLIAQELIINESQCLNFNTLNM